MGRGIAQAGHSVHVFDTFADAELKALASVQAMIDKGVDRGQFTAEQGAAFKAEINPCAAIEEFADCDVVIEAIVEDMAAKQTLCIAPENIVSRRSILATNTSSLTVDENAALRLVAQSAVRLWKAPNADAHPSDECRGARRQARDVRRRRSSEYHQRQPRLHRAARARNHRQDRREHAQHVIASVADIEDAVKLGLGLSLLTPEASR